MTAQSTKSSKSTKSLNTIYQHNACKFLIGAQRIVDFPEDNISEFAFIGRSNVGKSSLINALFNSGKVARTSKRPGCTQQINFFSIANGTFRIVDLPGYGYANASKQSISDWQHLVWYYFNHRNNLRQTFLLIDSRRGIMSGDSEFMEAMSVRGLKFYVILSKIDKLNDDERREAVNTILNACHYYPSMYNNVISTSSEKRIGLDLLRKTIVIGSK